jgi:RND family efflux transporter MFP subunit
MKKLLTGLSIIALFFITGYYLFSEDKHDEHDGHYHKEKVKEKHEEHGEKVKDVHEGHDGHKHKGEAKDKHDDHAEEKGELKLTDEQKKEINLKLAEAGTGTIQKEFTLPGEVVLNEDTVVHLVPRVSGIVIKVNKSLGEKVKKGEVLAILDSSELGEAKSEYYERFNEVGCCKIDLDRAIIIEENTRIAINDLHKLPSLNELRKKEYGDMGEYRAILLSSYTEFLTSKTNYERSVKLFKKHIVSENEHLKERNNYEKAEAEFYAKLHDAKFQIRKNLFDKRKNQRVSEFKLKAAELKLKILGLTKNQIKLIQADITKIQEECNELNCKDCKKVDKSNKKLEEQNNEDLFSQIKITAPAKGTIIQKHISLGEKIDDDDDNDVDIYTIADLSTVWVNIKIPARDISLVRKGTKVLIESPYGGVRADGKVSLISPIVDEATRTATARIVLDNPNEFWKPGSFVSAHVSISAKNLPFVVPRGAIQNLEGKDVLFVSDGHGFKPITVKTGRSDRKNVEIIDGLKPGMRYVTTGAFELKAMMITSGLDSHAGHGH